MPWKECDAVSLRRELVELAMMPDANKSELARRFGVRRQTLYKWLRRFRLGGLEGLRDRSRRPRKVRNPTRASLEAKIVALRKEHPAWGGRKIRRRLKNQGCTGLPQASTITDILHRHHLIDPRESAKRQELTRFERPRPNDLWQMDFKGEFKLGAGGWCHPLTVLDDHSRYSLGVRACGDHKSLTVRQQLIGIFRWYGLPRQMLMDHGVPWFTAHSEGGWTQLVVWLLQYDVSVTHGRVCHPQTQGKDERFHRTFKAELKPGPWIVDLADAQRRFDPWRESYNHERPHEALGMETPSSRYVVSDREYREVPPEVVYAGHDLVRSVNPVGQFTFQGRTCKTSEAFQSQRIAMRPTVWDGLFEVYFSRHRIGWLDLRNSGPKGGGTRVLPRRPEDVGSPESGAANDAAG